ncbi:(2Fe-2S) ferredoxin domain-containing protein [Pendulispora albinea]|uniref:(2Fe-2S) ferredoxin domain-containing protein n=1 Tax=Pendulispora albinea TaxID=2741071 RepID=A0ABZ2LS00_9BACT
MKKAPLHPQLHFFVCCNRRQNSPLGPGCSANGDAVYAALKKRVQQRGEIRSVWVTQTGCLGICPAKGATVAIYPEQAIATEVELSDIDALYEIGLAKKKIE